MQGVATVTSSYEWPSGQAVLGRSLVTLANSHAAWFITDYSRAIEFAEEARRGFESIGYGRYAARAGDLTSLLANWADLAGKPVMPSAPSGSISLSELLAAKGEIKILQGIRPSRALSLLQFAVAFAKQPNATREIQLPTCIALEEAGEFVLVTPLAANSFKRAERALRSVMGIASQDASSFGSGLTTGLWTSAPRRTGRSRQRSRVRSARPACLIHCPTAVNRSFPAAVNVQTAIATRQARGADLPLRRARVRQRLQLRPGSWPPGPDLAVALWNGPTASFDLAPLRRARGR